MNPPFSHTSYKLSIITVHNIPVDKEDVDPASAKEPVESRC
jgi:hypothetical protein